MYYGHFSHDEAMNLPIWKRSWFRDRIKEQVEREQSNNNLQGR